MRDMNRVEVMFSTGHDGLFVLLTFMGFVIDKRQFGLKTDIMLFMHLYLLTFSH